MLTLIIDVLVNSGLLYEDRSGPSGVRCRWHV